MELLPLPGEESASHQRAERGQPGSREESDHAVVPFSIRVLRGQRVPLGFVSVQRPLLVVRWFGFPRAVQQFVDGRPRHGHRWQGRSA